MNESIKNTQNRLAKFISDVIQNSPHLKDKKVINAMLSVDRALFVPKEYTHRAYDISVIGLDGYTLSEPGLVGYMIQSLDIKPSDTILDIGSGSGYHAGIMSRLCKAVYGVEVLPHAVERSRRSLKQSNCNNVFIKLGDGWDGWKEHAPYDLINVACSADKIPITLLEQLKVGGKMIIPLDISTEKDDYELWQKLSLITKKGEPSENENCLPHYTIKELTSVRFVPMIHTYH